MVQIEQEPGLLEDVLRALGDDNSKNLGNIFASYMQFNDKMSYDPGPQDGNSPPTKGLNGPVYNASTGAAGDMQTLVDRTQPDTGLNRSAMQRFLSMVHDTEGVATCNKDQAVVHAQGIPLLGSADVCQGGLCSLGSKPFPECGVFKIDNLATFYLDSIVGKANLQFRFELPLDRHRRPRRSDRRAHREIERHRARSERQERWHRLPDEPVRRFLGQDG